MDSKNIPMQKLVSLATWSSCDGSLHSKDDVRALFMLVQSPVFAAQSSYTILAHLLRQVVSLAPADHQLLVGWFKM
ncbi:Putative E3 ubiquitin-protein ligase HECTD2 [Gryllus bimaculatus]|nr:Putative E3 ubiquitin-protein ligase HECTD2 [Gryllus bimaculatus]